MVSPRYLDELRKLPSSVLSFEKAFSEVGHWTETSRIR